MKWRLLLLLLLPVLAAAQQRVPWTTSRIQGSPEPPKPCIAEPVFTQFSFNNGLEMVAADGRLFIVENGGKIWSFNEKEPAVTPDLLIDLKALHHGLDHAYSLAFHPKWRRNKELFVTFTLGSGKDDGTRLSRFKLLDAQPPQIDPASEEVLLTWRSGGHNGASIQFGPDGMLYITTGDAEVPSPPDPLNTGQDNRDLLSSILRIDVDRREAGLAYAVPPDNPFLGKADVRPEIWAFGFRNPWKMSFDKNGRLWCGDVGWELWEMIHLVQRGSNHGWSAMEASQPVKPELASPLAPITPPVVAHPHTEAASITGGFVYEGERLPHLKGAYIYGDYETGKIWALWHDGSRITRHDEIADTPHKIVTFGRTEDGEIYHIHYGIPSPIYRLAPNPQTGKPSGFPRRLSETGLFASTAQQQPAAGVREFNIAEPMWHDGAAARRFIAVPGDAGVQTTIRWRRDGSIDRAVVTWPTGSVLAKTLSWPGRPERRIETQVLHFDGETWNGYSYRWNEEGTDAGLVGADGDEVRLPGKPAWRIHSRAECARCHNAWSGFALAFQPQQLLDAASFISDGLVTPEFLEQSTARLVSSRDTTQAAEARARAWLHANCAHCHRRHGGGSVPLMVNAELPLDRMAMLNEPPTRGAFGIVNARVVAPGAPANSTLLYRLAVHGSGHMPMIGAREVDTAGWNLLWQWITALPADPAADENHAAAWENAGEDQIRQLISTVPGALRLVRALDMDQLSATARVAAVQAGTGTPDASVRALFERFRPPEQRTATLGMHIDAARLLAMKGDAARGAPLLSPQGSMAACLACHFVNGMGRDFGPDLSKVGARLAREQILESLLHPSKVIAPGYQAHMLETRDGQTQAGFIVGQSAAGVTLKLATGNAQDFARDNIKSQKPLPASLMPEGLLQFLTAQEVADLVEYLSSLK